MRYPAVGILLYTLRYAQHHAAQLNLLLRQSIDDAPGWVYKSYCPARVRPRSNSKPMGYLNLK